MTDCYAGSIKIVFPLLFLFISVIGKELKEKFRDLLEPGSGIEKFGSGIRNKNIPIRNISRIRDLFDPGSGMEKFGSGINIPYPQHWPRG
jgi:hypothetical protein